MGYSVNHRHDVKALNRKLFELSKARPGDAPVHGLIKFVERINPKLHVKLVAPATKTSVRFSTYNTMKLTAEQQAEFDRMYMVESTRKLTATMEKWRKDGKLAVSVGPIDQYGWERYQEYSLPGLDKMPSDVIRTADKVTKITKAHAEDLQIIMNELAAEQTERGWCEVYEDSVAVLNQVCVAQLPKPVVKHIVTAAMQFKFELPGQEDLTYSNRSEKQLEVRNAVQEELNKATSLDDAIAVLQKYKAVEDPENRGTYVSTSGLLRRPVLV